MAKATTGKKKTFRKKEKKNIPVGIVHISASFNNTLISITDTEGNLVAPARLRALLLAGGALRLLRVGRLALARVVDELDDSQFGVVAVAAAEADDTRVAARPLGVALAQLVEEALERGDARRAGRARLAAPAGRGRLLRVAGVEEACGLAAQV